ncbi:hypothetical protein [Parasulfitobacter algicola]|uniref:Uncharacterized protein n=1 Tax=Parasulfitobacter algicola TaxID=2614809 RepID=A0ABX2J0T4_9RHOB|nr:hypothetical protein [Sulfitobacter algicola]NSX56754.1 hypothetical protein [Sulfitobacter algicola]
MSFSNTAEAPTLEITKKYPNQAFDQIPESRHHGAEWANMINAHICHDAIEALVYKSLNAAYDQAMTDNYLSTSNKSVVVPVAIKCVELGWVSAIAYRKIDAHAINDVLTMLLFDLDRSSGIVVLRSHSEILIGSGLIKY